MKPLPTELVKNGGGIPEVFTADAGYWSDENARFCEELGTDANIATGREGTAPKEKDGSPPRAKQSELKQAMTRKLKTESGKAKYARRKAAWEPPFGQIKEARSLRRSLLRGMDQVSEEWNLMCLTHNLLKLFRAQGAAKQASACPAGLPLGAGVGSSGRCGAFRVARHDSTGSAFGSDPRRSLCATGS